MKRTVSFVLICAMILSGMSLFSLSGAGEDPEPENAEPMRIGSVSDLEQLREHPDRDAVLTADLEIISSDWKPIGDAERPYSGVFDGGGHTITLGLTFKNSGKGVIAGLFGYVSGSVKRLRTEGTLKATVGSGCVGAICAVLRDGGRIFSCRQEAELDLELRAASAAGGIAGAVFFSGKEADGSLLSCINEGAIRASVTTNAAGDGSPLSVGTNGAIGGLLGFVADNAHAEVKQCVNTGSISVSGGKYNIGGIVGQTCVNSSETGIDLLECANKGNIEVRRIAGERAAGIIGYIKSGRIEDCYNLGRVDAWSDDGKTVSRIGYGTRYGIFGYANLGAGNTLSVLRCYNASPEPLEAEICVVRNPAYGVFENYYMAGREEYELELNAANVGAGKKGRAFSNAASLTEALLAAGTKYKAVSGENGEKLFPALSFESDNVLPISGEVSLFCSVRKHADSFILRVIVHAKDALLGGVFETRCGVPGGETEVNTAILGRDLQRRSRVYADGVPYIPAEGCSLFVSELSCGYGQAEGEIGIRCLFGGQLVKETTVSFETLFGRQPRESATLEGLPDYPDGKASAVYNAGPGLQNDKKGVTDSDCPMVVISGTTAASFGAWLETLRLQGYRTVYEKAIGKLDCRQIVKDGKLYYVYFTSSAGEVRIIADNASSGPVSQVTEPEASVRPVLYQYAIDYTKGTGQTSGRDFWEIDCGMFYIFRLSDNSLFLIDGGHMRQTSVAALEALNAFLHEITGTPDGDKVKITGWFFSHAHGDHVYLGHAFLEKYHEQYDLEGVYCNFPSYQTMPKGYDAGTFLLKDTINACYPDCKCYKLHSGQTFDLSGVAFEVLCTHEDAVKKESGTSAISDFNDTSTVIRATVNGKSVLFTGDTSGVTETRLLRNYSKSFLHSDAIQMSHHSINSVVNLYNAVSAPLLLCPNSKENADLHAANRQGAISAAGKAFRDILYAGEYTYKLTFDDTLGYEIDRPGYTQGFYVPKPAELDIFSGEKQDEKPLDASALEGMTDLSSYIIDKSGRGTPGTNADEAPQRIFDGSTATKWCENATAKPYVIFRSRVPLKIGAYVLYAGNDTANHADRNPKSWTLWGSADGEHWSVIDSVYNGRMNTANFSASVYKTDGETEEYLYFALCIHALSGSGTTMQLSEIKLYGFSPEGGTL